MLEAPVVSVHLPRALQALAAGRGEVIASGETVGEALRALEHAHPSLVGHILRSNGQLLPALDVYLGATEIRALRGLDTPIAGAEVIAIVPRAPLPPAGEISVG